MAESISEGTLRSFSKQVRDQVEQDEEIAFIETDKGLEAPSRILVRLADACPPRLTFPSMRLRLARSKNSLLVTVGQDIAKIEPEKAEVAASKKLARLQKSPPRASSLPLQTQNQRTTCQSRKN